MHMSPEQAELEETIEERSEAKYDPLTFNPEAQLNKYWDEAIEDAYHMAPVSSLKELVAASGENGEFSYKDMLLSRMRESGNASLADMAEQLEDTPESVFGELSIRSAEALEVEDLIFELDVEYDGVYEIYKRLAEKEDHSFTIAKDPSEKRTLVYIDDIDPYARAFYHDSTLTVSLMEEYWDIFEEVDWDEEASRREKAFHAQDVAHKMAFFCGIANTSDVYRQFLTWYPDEDIWGDDNVFTMMLRQISLNHDIYDTGFSVVDFEEDEHDPIVVSFELWNLCGCFDDSVAREKVEETFQSISEPLLDRHEITGFWGLHEDIKDVDPLEYASEIPQARRLAQFLDEHVPENANKLNYAEATLDTLVCLIIGQPSDPQRTLEIVMDTGIVQLDSFEEMQEFVDCFMNLHNALPCWANYGSSPNGLRDVSTGRKTFYDEHGRPKKVGRNDPCPCGSGKKYKRCCGRNG